MPMGAPIFIISNFRSGSTLLRYMLDTHPDVCCPGEMRLGHLCQRLFNSVEPVSGGAAMDDEDAVDYAEPVGVVRRLVDEIMASYCLRKGKVRWCEKSPANVEMLNVLSTVFADAHFICLHRHAVDQSCSTLDVEGTAHLQSYLTRQSGNAAAAALDRWCDVSERLLALEHAHHRKALRVRYEDLVSDPEGEVERMTKFLGLRAVPNLSVEAFKVKHDRGARDPKIARTGRVHRDRVGAAGGIELEALPVELRSRVSALLRVLDYESSPGSTAS